MREGVSCTWGGGGHSEGGRAMMEEGKREKCGAA